jgi:hypothetical protein
MSSHVAGYSARAGAAQVPMLQDDDRDHLYRRGSRRI